MPCSLPSRALLAVLLAASGAAAQPADQLQRKVGVVYVFHGSAQLAGERSAWEAALQTFAYDPHGPAYRDLIWRRESWPRILAAGDAPLQLRKDAFSYARIGGANPAARHAVATYERLKRRLEARERELGVDFLVDYASWIAPDDPRHHAYPRLIHEPRVAGGAPMVHCGSPAQDAAWRGCDPQRYDVDGTIERLLGAEVEEIVMIDLTAGGVRCYQSWDVVNLARQVAASKRAGRGARAVPIRWANDPTDLMTASYPRLPERWTASLGEPTQDRQVPLEGRPNPVAADARLAAAHVRGIEARLSPRVPIARTGILLVNHATPAGNRWFDPKINDTLLLNANIEKQLLARHRRLDADNIVAAWFGRREVNPHIEPRPPHFSQLERTRGMRGEDRGDAWLYESDLRPTGEQGFLYWDALDYLKARGVRHIVIAFPQLPADSVLNLVELPNQIAKEIGSRTWLRSRRPDFASYPGVGHPFADYWGNWVEKTCPAPGGGTTVPCCFEMGGCRDGRPYPPPRLTPVDRPRGGLDPSLAFDVAAYGHLGYDPARGRPRESAPVQHQYRGTWLLWQPPGDDPLIAELLADQVLRMLDPDGAHPAPATAIPLHGLR